MAFSEQELGDFYIAKERNNSVQEQPAERGEVFANSLFNKELVFRILLLIYIIVLL